jgi:hypothetical protein
VPILINTRVTSTCDRTAHQLLINFCDVSDPKCKKAQNEKYSIGGTCEVPWAAPYAVDTICADVSKSRPR